MASDTATRSRRHPCVVGRRARARRELALHGTPTAAPERVGRRRMGRLGQQPSRPLLHADRGRAASISRRRPASSTTSSPPSSASCVRRSGGRTSPSAAACDDSRICCIAGGASRTSPTKSRSTATLAEQDHRARVFRPEDARRATSRRMGNAHAGARSGASRLGSGRFRRASVQDLRYAWRGLIRSKALLVVACLSLGVSTGFGTACSAS